MTIRTKITPLGAGNTVYPKDFVVFESSTPGTYTFEIKKAQFEVTGSGAGGGGGGSAGKHAWYGQVGGSAAAFKGIVQLEKGVLKITVGTPGNGGNGSGRNASPGSNGTATTIVLNNVTLLTLGGGNGGGGTGDSYFSERIFMSLSIGGANNINIFHHLLTPSVYHKVYIEFMRLQCFLFLSQNDLRLRCF